MTEERKKKIRRRITILTFVCIALLAALLVVLAMTEKLDTILFPLGAGVVLAFYWVVLDVLSVIWLHSFEGKTEAQKKSYCFYAIADAAGLAGLLCFVINMASMNGALIFVISFFLKRRFYDEYLGVKRESEEAPETEVAENRDVKAITAEEEDIRTTAVEEEDVRATAAESEDVKAITEESEDAKTAVAEEENVRATAAESEDVRAIAAENEDVKTAVAEEDVRTTAAEEENPESQL